MVLIDRADNEASFRRKAKADSAASSPDSLALEVPCFSRLASPSLKHEIVKKKKKKSLALFY